MKKLIVTDPDTLDTHVEATFKLTKGGRVVTQWTNDESPWQSVVRVLVGAGNEPITPADGEAYYDLLSEVHGTFYAVTE